MNAARHARGISLTVNTFIRIQLVLIKVWDIEIRWNLQNKVIMYSVSAKK